MRFLFFNLFEKTAKFQEAIISHYFLKIQIFKIQLDFHWNSSQFPLQLWSQNTISAFILSHGITVLRNHRVNQMQNAPNPSCFGVFHLQIKAFHARQQLFNAFAPCVHNFHLKTLLGWLLWWCCLLARRATLMQKLRRRFQVLFFQRMWCFR